MNRIKSRQLLLSLCVMSAFAVHAQNPIVQSVYTADPAPLVHNDTLFLYTGHDEDSATSKGFIMDDYLCFSTTDMVNWTHHGPVFSTPSLGWAAKHNANAAQVVFRNNQFYYYISPWSALPDGGDCLAVGVSANATGPFRDALGKPLVAASRTTYSKHSWEDIDPTVLINDDGQAWLYWGNNSLYCAKLNKDMISLDGDIRHFDIKDSTAFGPDYEEAPWIFKRNNLYYLLYAAHVPEAVYYSSSTSPTGPWKYGGVVMDAWAQGSMGNHPGIAQYKGNWYFFYMNEDLPGGHDKRRAVNVRQFDFNPDGSIPKLSHSKEGIVKSLKPLDPYRLVQAETIAWSENIETASTSQGTFVTSINDGSYIRVREVDLGKGASGIEIATRLAVAGATIEVRADNLKGPLLATCTPKAGSSNWIRENFKTAGATGIHDLYFVFRGNKKNAETLFEFDSWMFR